MTQFIAIKIHYDHRSSLPAELKYSKPVTGREHEEYLDLFEQGIGGEGFHECLNYFIPENGPVRMYLPPTCVPGANSISDEFVIFSFTYVGDQEMPSRIVGVHGGAQILNRNGLPRIERNEVDLVYHVEAPSELVTLFPSPLQYNSPDGRYTPSYRLWGYGLRYIDKSHAANIVFDQLDVARNELIDLADESKRIVVEREVLILENIAARYFGSVGNARAREDGHRANAGPVGIPDKELGELGEKHIYDRELNLASKLGQAASQVKWVSRGNPQSPFDIRSIRESRGTVRDHYIEVKSTTVLDDTHIFLSSREIAFLDEHKDQCAIVLVRFNRDRSVKDVRDLTIGELRERFELIPMAFKLRPVQQKRSDHSLNEPSDIGTLRSYPTVASFMRPTCWRITEKAAKAA